MSDILELIMRSDGELVVSAETASNYHGLSSSHLFTPVVLRATAVPLKSSGFLLVPCNKLDLRHTIEISEKKYITNRERTIVDMIRFESDERFLFESLDWYFIYEESYGRLKEVAEEYGVLDILLEKINELPEWKKDFYGN